MSFQRTLLFSFAMSAAAFGCHKDRSGKPETSSSVVEGTTPDTTNTNTNANPAPSAATDTVTPSTATAPDTTVPSSSDSTTPKRVVRSGGTATAGGTATVTGTGTTNTATDTTTTNTMNSATTDQAPTPAAAPTAPTDDPAVKPDDRKTLRQGTGWYRSDRNDGPKNTQ